MPRLFLFVDVFRSSDFQSTSVEDNDIDTLKMSMEPEEMTLLHKIDAYREFGA